MSAASIATTFRAAADAGAGSERGKRGRALFHPIRVALTGEAGGPELDLAVPAIDRGARAAALRRGVALVLGCRERAAMFARTGCGEMGGAVER